MRILVLEDNPAEAERVRLALAEGLQARVQVVESVAEALAAVPASVVLTDLNVLDSQGLDTVTALLTRNEPIIALTGLEGEDLGERALRAGATDFLPKAEMTGVALRRCVRHALERQRLEQERQRAMEELAAAIHANPDGVGVVDAAGRVCLTNPALTQLTGLFVGRAWTRESDVELIRGPRTVELRDRPTQWNGQPARLLLARDVTDDRRNTRLAAQREEQLRRSEAQAALGRFSARMAHQYSNGITALRMQLQDIERRHPGTAQDLDECRQELDRLAAITRGVAALRRERSVTPRGSTLLDRLVRDSLPLLQALGEPEVEVHVDLGAPDARVGLDEDQLRAVLRHLVQNAVQAMGRGTVQVQTRVQDATVVLKVVDSGPGPEPEVLSKAFEPFFTTTDERLGLGLTVVKSLVEGVHGHVALSHAAAQTVVEVRLPLTRVAKQPVQTSQRGCVLVVDDERYLREVLSRVLRHSGFQVVLAADGVEALESLEGVDVVLTDVRMPRMDGTVLARTLAERHPHLPVVLMSGHAEARPDDGRRWLAKPFKANDVVQTLSDALHRAQKETVNTDP